MQQDVFDVVGSHTWNNPGVSEVEVLVVAGGGGAGKRHGGGGGAGEVIYSSAFSVSGDQSVTVGDGGAGASGLKNPPKGDNGANSSFGTLTAVGGGGAGTFTDDYTRADGKNGGSGGGAAEQNPTTYGGSGQSGSSGGDVIGDGSPYIGAGGGGQTQAGQTVDPGAGDPGGDGGDGAYHGDVFGDTYGENGYFGGGGGGAGDGGGAGTGGLGGGADGVQGDTEGLNGMANTGGGGGGSRSATANADIDGGDGGSGIVIVRYESPPSSPTNSDAIYAADDQVDFSWDVDTSGGPINSFDVEILRDGNTWQVPTGGPSSVSHDGSASYAKSYGPNSDNSYGSQVGIDSSFQFRVRAAGPGGNSGWSYSDTVYTTPVPPHNPSVSRPDANTVKINAVKQSDIGDYVRVEIREDTGSGYGSWTLFDVAESSESQFSGGYSKGDSYTLTYNVGTAYQGDTLQEDARYQFRVFEDRYSSSRRSVPVYADYGNEGNVYFEDDFEDQDLAEWDTTNLVGSTGVKDGTWTEGMGELGISGPEQGSYFLWMESGSSTTRNLGDLSSETDVIVKAVVASGSLDTASEVNTIGWYDGSAWQTLRSFSHEYNRQGWVEVTALVPSSYLSTDNRVRINSYDSGGSGDYMAVDHVVVSDVLHEYTAPSDPSSLGFDASVERELTASWTDNATFANKQDRDYRKTGASSWTQITEAYATTETLTSLLDGERYDLRVRAVVDQYRNGAYSQAHPSAFISGAATTILPDEDTPVLNFTDTTIGPDREGTVSNYGSIEFEVREASSGTVVKTKTIPYDTVTTTISGLQSGTVYEVRARTTTEHVNGTWTSWQRVKTTMLRNPSVSGDGQIVLTRSGLSKSRQTALSADGEISASRVKSLSRNVSISGSGRLTTSRGPLTMPRNASISGDGHIESDIQFFEAFPSELTNGIEWDFDFDRLAFVSEWVPFQGSDGYGTASLYISGTLGSVDPCCPTVVLEFDAEGNGEVDEQSDPKSVPYTDEPVTFPSISGRSGYYRVVMRDVRPSDILDQVLFGPSHT